MEPTTDTTDVDNIPLSEVERWGGYWRTQVSRKQRLHDISAQQILIGQMLTMIITMAAGVYVDQNKEALLLVGTTFILYPVIAELLSSNAAVLTASLNHEIDRIENSKTLAVLTSLSKSLLVTVVASFFLGVMTGLVGIVLFDANFINTVLLAVVTGGLTSLFGLPIMTLVLFAARKMQANPDDVTPPLETTIFHSVTLLIIVIASRFIT